jgi:hypothetical protein
VAEAGGGGYDGRMAAGLEREEHIEQAFFFRVLRERLASGMAAQEVLERIDQEILSTTRLPYAVQFLAAELKHSGLLSSGFARLPHYFTPYQAFLVRGTEQEALRFNVDFALLALQREAEFKAGGPAPPGLFVYQFEVMCRNRLGYDDGLKAMAADPLYDADWRAFIDDLRRQIGLVDFGDILYLRSAEYVRERRRREPGYQPELPPLFGEKEGKIARAHHGRDPLYLFAALQRQLGYPEAPRPRPRDDLQAKLDGLQARLRELEQRLKLVEGEVRGQVDLSQFGRPELLSDEDE